ncbi:hypothetical protein [Pectobacterium aroidearum]|uniref:hypothetical protein n=1 Tax=Pectobacterium aroidearum TaxID=1201031 RepID=UPI00262BE185|nr:hypothetical protein [Pectobacterium aroidearum]WKA64160.1 hypothetical protein QX495_08585 [Pectobacterium aroidearum]
MNKYKELDRKCSEEFEKYNFILNEKAIKNKARKHQIVAIYNQLNLIFKSVLKKTSPFLFKYKSEKIEFKYSRLNDGVVISFPVITNGKISISIRPKNYTQNISFIFLTCNGEDYDVLNSYFKLKYDTLEEDGHEDKHWQLKTDPDSGSLYTKLDEYAVKRILSYVIRNHTDLGN